MPGPGLSVHCQPLHASYLSQCKPARVVKKPRSDGYKLAADGDPNVLPLIPLDHYPDDLLEDWMELKRPE